MATSYDRALAALYQSPHDAFVGERKRLAAELKAEGDAAGSARLARLGRPTISAWAVNQLYWHARDAFEALLDTAERVRKGNLKATTEHREALAKLRARAVKLLGEAGHATTEATLRRVTTTLSALAAEGGFDPDPPGALSSDRDPPGFTAFGAAEAGDARPEPERREPSGAAGERAAKKARAEAEAERRRLEAERERKKAERERLRAALKQAKEEAKEQARAVAQLQKELAAKEKELEGARTAVEELETRVGELDADG